MSGRDRRDKNGRAVVRLGKTNSAILAGDEDLREWDEEELRRGQRKSEGGSFHGTPPKVVPLAVHQELVRRQMTRATELFRDNLYAAVEVLCEIATNPDAPASDRIKASSMIVERVMGKAPERVELAVEQEADLAANAGSGDRFKSGNAP